jgi:hypothetical protein
LFPNGRRFALSDQPGYGVSCGATGVFVGAVPLLQPCRNCGNFQKWRARPLDEINRELSMCYGVPVDFGAKVERLAAIARALDRGDLLHAHIATLHLQIPDPPLLAKGPRSAAELVTLAKDLHASGMLERDWDPSPVVTGRAADRCRRAAQARVSVGLLLSILASSLLGTRRVAPSSCTRQSMQSPRLQRFDEIV